MSLGVVAKATLLSRSVSTAPQVRRRFMLEGESVFPCELSRRCCEQLD
jgi:hypothetical protein